MTALQQITIKSPISEKCEVTVTLAESGSSYIVLVLTIRDGVHKEFTRHSCDYTAALEQFLLDVAFYAKYVSLMNL